MISVSLARDEINALMPIVSTVSGSVTDVLPLSSAKPSGISITCACISICANDSQLLNALLPSVVTVDGIVMDVSPELAKA